MAINLNNGSSRGRKRGARATPFAEINITPMVDVMLVLLIIFMVAAPMMTTGVTVDLPKTSATPVTGQDEPLIVSITKDGTIYIEKTPVPFKDLESRLSAIVGEKKETRIFVRGDTHVDYGRIMQVVGAINSAGLSKVALITDVAAEKTGKDK